VQGPLAMARQTTTVTGCRRVTWSVVRDGMVQAKRTESPMRTAERFWTGVGKLRLGGSGAAGVPQPIMIRSSDSARAETRSLRFMHFKRKSFFCRRQDRAQSGVQLRIFEVETGGSQPGGHDPLASQDSGLRHFPKG
jgi:hypothetical protein